MKEILYSLIEDKDYEVLTDIMTRAFNDDTRIHIDLKEDGPKGYNDGTLIRKLNENPKYISRKINYENKIVGAYTIYENINNVASLEMLFIDPDYSNMNLGKSVWNHVESTYSNVKKWTVETPSYSKRNHYFYINKCGFVLCSEKNYEDGEMSFMFEKVINEDINIREINNKDAKKLLDMFLLLDKETSYMMFEPGERPNDIGRIEGMVKQYTEGDSLMLVATNCDNIIGFLSAQRGMPRRIRHTAYIVVGIREEFRGKGLGQSLFSKLDLWAKENNISRLELTVMCPNVIAKKLYERSGFEVEGIKKKSMLVNGEYVDEFYMAKVY